MDRSISIFARLVLMASAAATCPVFGQDNPPDPVAFSVHAPPPPADLGRRASASAVGRIEIFEDWAVGCDNRLACGAYSLLPENASRPYAMLLVISRAGGTDGALSLQFLAADPIEGRIDLIVDGKRTARIKANPDGAELSGDAALALVRNLGSSFTFTVAQEKTVLVQPSLTGLQSALRYIDQQQGRVGARDALIAVGEGDPANARAVPPLPAALPPVAGVAALAPGPNQPDPPALPPLSADDEAGVRKLAVCEGMLKSSYPPGLHSLDASHELVLLPCDAGADNVSFVPLIASGPAGARTFAIARFDMIPGFGDEPGAPPLVVNARWNAQLGMLSSFAKGRGLGDCGTAENYRWDGQQFRLADARAMPVCRGAWEWPRIFSDR